MKLEFTPFEAEQPLRGMKLQEKDAQKDKVCWKSVQKEPKEKMSVNFRVTAIQIIV